MLSPPVEGSYVASRRIIDAVTRRGVTAKVLTAEPFHHTSRIANGWSTVKCEQLSKELEFSPSKSSYLRAFARTSISDFATSTRLSTYVKSTTCDIVHVLNINKEIFLVVHNLLQVRKPLLLHFYHSPEVLADDVFQLRHIAMRIGLFGRLLESHILTTSTSLSKFFIQLGVNPKKVHHAPYPVDTGVFKPLTDTHSLRRKYGVNRANPILAYVGSLNVARGVFDLIRSFRIVVDRFPKALLYVSHPQRKGENVYAEKIRRMTWKLRLQKNMLVRGAAPRITEVFNLADVVALPFKRPYWMDPPIVLLEAMSTGAPVVTTSVGAIQDVIEDNENAVLAEPANHVDLANRIIELFEDPEKSREIGQQARKTVAQKYSYGAVGTQLLKIYNRVLDS